MDYDFQVVQRPLRYSPDEGGVVSTVPDKKVLINYESGEVLSIVSDRYEITHHKEVIDVFDAIEGITREDIHLSEDGGVMFAKYNLPNHGTDEHVVTVGQTVKFSLRVFNSYNLITSRGCELIAHNLICNNGMVVPKHVATIAFRHMNNDGMSRLGSRIGEYSNDMSSIVQTWKDWLTIRPSANCISDFVVGMQLGTEEIQNEMTQEMLSKSNLWEVYNVMTYYITHQMVNRGKNKIANQRKKAYEYTDMFYKYTW